MNPGVRLKPDTPRPLPGYPGVRLKPDTLRPMPGFSRASGFALV